MAFVDENNNEIPLSELKKDVGADASNIETLASKQAEGQKEGELEGGPSATPEPEPEETPEGEPAADEPADSWLAKKGGKEYVDMGLRFYDAIQDEAGVPHEEFAEILERELPTRYNGIAAAIFSKHENWVNNTVAQRQFGVSFEELQDIVKGNSKSAEDLSIEELEASEDEADRHRAKLLRENKELREANAREQSRLREKLDADEQQRIALGQQKTAAPVLNAIDESLNAAGFKPLTWRPGRPMTPDQLERIMVTVAVQTLFDADAAGGAHLAKANKHIEEKREQSAYALIPTMTETAKKTAAQVINHFNELKSKARKYDELQAKPGLIRKEVPAAAAIGATSAGAGLTANTSVGNGAKRPKPGTREDDAAILAEVASLRARGLVS